MMDNHIGEILIIGLAIGGMAVVLLLMMAFFSYLEGLLTLIN
jgi:hypothetical protein